MKGLTKTLSMLSLAMKAGKVKSGEFAVTEEIKKGTAYLVIVADDASDRTKKTYKDSCAFYDVPMYTYSDMESLGRALGKEFRAAVAITDENFAKGIVDKISEEKNKTEE